jgi:trigger factor
MEATRKLAARRVQVGFVIAEIAKKEGVKATNDEIIEAISNIARLYPGQEKSIFDMYTRGENIKIVVGPILESKVVTRLLNIVKLKEQKCTVPELIAIDEEPFDFLVDDDVPSGANASSAAAKAKSSAIGKTKAKAAKPNAKSSGDDGEKKQTEQPSKVPASKGKASAKPSARQTAAATVDVDARVAKNADKKTEASPKKSKKTAKTSTP